MTPEKQPEKLIILPEKIIHILLKHLMFLKNENAYLNNYKRLQSLENDIANKNIGAKYFGEGITDKNIGTDSSNYGIADKSIGTDSSNYGIEDKNIGTDSSNYGIADKNIGTDSSNYGIADKNIGTDSSNYGIADKNIGTKSIFEALSVIKAGTNSGSLEYTVFEQGLIRALEQYIKNGNGQYTLYSFYADFVEAVAEKNSSAEKTKEALSNLSLEETHILPEQITIVVEALEKLKVALHEYLPPTSKSDLYRNVAYELLLIYNKRKATGMELRDFTGLSESGFKKHLPKLKRFGLIKTQPPSNYVLTEKSTHLLLKTFGVPKNK